MASRSENQLEQQDQFPAGLRVLVVDDDNMTLMILERMLRCCSYTVTTCGKATTALTMLRENKNKFDLVISDVYMPDMDGFKLLELVGLEMDLPVIMMSSDGETSNVMKGITHGACDYLLKPVRMEELRNIWQHVVRKKKNEVKEIENTSPKEHKRDEENASSTSSKKRKDIKEEEDDNEQDDDPSSLKKPRVVWSVELHQQFVTAVHQLGIDKAVPKRILELMNVPGLTRENVASHLQKYRISLKRLSLQQQQNGMNLPYAGTTDSAYLDRIVSVSGNNNTFSIPAAQPGVLCRTSSSIDPTALLQFSSGQGNSLVRPRLPSPIFTTQPSYLPAFTGSFHLDPGGPPVSPYGQLTQSSNIGGTLQPGKQHLNIVGNFGTSQSSNNLMVQLLQHRHQQYGNHQGTTSIEGNLGQRVIPSEVVISSVLGDDGGYVGTNDLLEDKNVSGLGSNFAAGNQFEDEHPGNKLQPLLNNNECLEGLSGFGYKSIGWQNQEFGQISSTTEQTSTAESRSDPIAKVGVQLDQIPSDDLLSFYLKQRQQEDLNFPDNELVFDGFVQDNLYVK